MVMFCSPGGRRGRRTPSRRVYVKLYEMLGDGKQSVTSSSFTIYGSTVKEVERLLRMAVAVDAQAHDAKGGD